MRMTSLQKHEPGGADVNHPIFGRLVAPGVEAPIHQHFFSYRLDFDIDRPDHNRVVEVTASGLPTGPDNPLGEWFAAQARTFHTEQDAGQSSAGSAWHQWRVLSTLDTNALGQPTGYALLPGDNTVPYPFADVGATSPRRIRGPPALGHAIQPARDVCGR